jgi:hypothetical protein
MSDAKGLDEFATMKDLREVRPLAIGAPFSRSPFRSWLLQDLPFITMLLLALVGVAFHMAAQYWGILTPVFCIICVVAGWSHFDTTEGRLQLAYTQALSWSGLIVTIYVLFNDVVQGVLDRTATSLAMLTLLALGTFVAGLQVRVWQICAVGAIMLFAVPGTGWLEQSVLFLVIAILAVTAVGFLTWWVQKRRLTTS